MRFSSASMALRAPGGNEGDVAVDRIQVLARVHVPGVQLAQAVSCPRLETGDRLPSRDVRPRVERRPVRHAGAEDLVLAREVVVHGQARHARIGGDRGDRRTRRTHRGVESHGGRRDPLPRRVDEVGPAPHDVRAPRHLFACTVGCLSNLDRTSSDIHYTALFTRVQARRSSATWPSTPRTGRPRRQGRPARRGGGRADLGQASASSSRSRGRYRRCGIGRRASVRGRGTRPSAPAYP